MLNPPVACHYCLWRLGFRTTVTSSLPDRIYADDVLYLMLVMLVMRAAFAAVLR